MVRIEKKPATKYSKTKETMPNQNRSRLFSILINAATHAREIIHPSDRNTGWLWLL